MNREEIKSQLATLKARYDSGPVPDQVYKIIRQLENELAWQQHKAADRRI